MVGKVFAGLTMGIVVALLTSMIVVVAAGGGEVGGMYGLPAAGLAFALTMLLAVRAQRPRYAWGRGMLLCGLACFLAVSPVIVGMIVVTISYALLRGGSNAAPTTTTTTTAAAVLPVALGTKACPSCSATIMAEAQLCPSCGAKFEAVPAL